MKLYIDVTCTLEIIYVSGIQRVLIEVACGLIERQHDVVLIKSCCDEKYKVVDNTKFYNYYKLGIGSKKDIVGRKSYRYSRIRNNSLFFDIDAVWSPFNKDRNSLYKTLHNNGVKRMVYIHDLIPLKWPDTVDDELIYRYIRYICAAFLYADVILNQTDSGVNAIKKFMIDHKFPEKRVYSTWLGANFGKKESDDILDESIVSLLDSKFILMTGTLEVRKNHKLVLDAFERQLFDKGFKLVLVGREDYRNEEVLNRVLKHDRLNKDLFFFNRLNDENLDALYRNAFMLAFPSYDEGFGLPIVESLVRKTPVIAADIPVMREVGGGLSIYFQQDNVDDFIEKILYYANHSDEYNLLKQKIEKYKPKTWDYVIDNIEQIIEEV